MDNELAYQLKRFKPDDLSGVKHLVYQTIDTLLSTHPSEVIAYWKQLHTSQQILRDVVKGHAIVLCDQTKIIATATLVDSTIKRLFIHPDYQRQGLGKTILDYLEKHALENGAIKVCVDASDEVKNFYLKNGYHVDQEEFLPLPNQNIHAYYKMSKSLLISSERLINFHKKMFRPLKGNEQGLADDAVLYHFQQTKNRVWVSFKGGQISYGQLLGLCQSDGSVTGHFHFINRMDNLLSGTCTLKPTRLVKGQLKLGVTCHYESSTHDDSIFVLKELRLNHHDQNEDDELVFENEKDDE